MFRALPTSQRSATREKPSSRAWLRYHGALQWSSSPIRGIQSAGSNAGLDDRKFPDIDLGEIIVVDVAKKSAIGYVSIATQ